MDRYDGNKYIINNKFYSEKEIRKYLQTIKFKENEINDYLSELVRDYIFKTEQ